MTLENMIHNSKNSLGMSHNLFVHIRWFTYVAAISLIEMKQSPDNLNLRTQTGFFLLVWLMPTMLLSAVAGVIADSHDRRKAIICIDLFAAIVTSGYFLAHYCDSIALVYIITFLRQSAGAIYQPCRIALVQMMVREDHLLKKATTLSTFVWAAVATCGSAMGGLTVARLGINVCFLLDMVAYLASASILYQIGGTWIADETTREDWEEQQPDSGHRHTHGMDGHDTKQNPLFPQSKVMTNVWQKGYSMIIDGIYYLRSQFFGPLIFLKFSSAILYGSLTVILVSISEMYSVDENGGKEDASTLLGILLACTGLGSFLGTAITDWFTDVKNARSLQLGCIWGFLCMGLAYLIMGIFLSFTMVCICSSLIYMGLIIIWNQSDLIFQLFCSSTMMGRVAAVDYALAMSSEGFSSFFSGIFEDRFHLSAQESCIMMSVMSIIIFISWFIFHIVGRRSSRHGLPSQCINSE